MKTFSRVGGVNIAGLCDPDRQIGGKRRLAGAALVISDNDEGGAGRGCGGLGPPWVTLRHVRSTDAHDVSRPGHLPEGEVLVQESRVLLLRVPAAPPGLDVPEAEPNGMDFLTHVTLLYLSPISSWM